MKKGAKTTLPSRPHAIESEKMVLGCMLSSNKALNIGSESLIARDFFLSKHQMIFDSLYEAYQGDKPADVHLIAEILRRKNQLDDAGGVPSCAAFACGALPQPASAGRSPPR